MTTSTSLITPEGNYIIHDAPFDGIDVAITSIDNMGTPGALNAFTLRKLGYDDRKNLPNVKELEEGYFWLKKNGLTPILFIVTIGGTQGSPELQLSQNLENALVHHKEDLSKKRVWVPLLGTGSAKIPLDKSFDIINELVFQFPKRLQTHFTISIPKGGYGDTFFESLQRRFEKIDFNKKPYTSLIPKSFTGNIYLIDQSILEANISKYIRNVSEGDVIILRTTNQKSNVITSVGKVIRSEENGIIVGIDWRITNLSISSDFIENPKSGVTILSKESELINSLINKIGFYEISDIKLFENPTITPLPVIPNLLCDSEFGKDQLKIDQDVNAFAKVIASKALTPPLAIALFGTWGSGKSFFMNSLRDKIAEYSEQGENQLFCEGIVQIHFNAWSYLDANLWASLVSSIFEKLNSYIKNHSNPDYKDQIEKELANKLVIAQEQIKGLENKKKELEDKKDDFEEEKRKLNDKVTQNIACIKTMTIEKVVNNIDEQFNVTDKVEHAINNTETGSITTDTIKAYLPEKYWNNPASLYGTISSHYTFARHFFSPLNATRNLVILAFILILIIAVPILILAFNDSISTIDILIPESTVTFIASLGIIGNRLKRTYSELQPVVASFWAIKNDYDKQIQNALDKNEQEQLALKLEIQKAEIQITNLDKQISDNELIIKDIEFKIHKALATESLFSFIEKRSLSNDYQKHLGLVSIIRKDFEVLSTLFTEHRSELRGGGKPFREMFDRPLERIVLYIDDLDRCPEDRVIEVLEAVNLLMAFPLFVVVVGVDSRWVNNALLYKYERQFNGSTTEKINTANFLEKIFQVPFHLRKATNDDIKSMIGFLSSPLVQTNKNSQEKSEFSKSTIDHKTDDQTTTYITESDYKKSNQTIQTKQLIYTPIRKADTIVIEHLTLSNQEAELLKSFANIIGNNPRGVKRFVNIYLVTKAHETLTYSKGNEKEIHSLLMLTIALPIGPFKSLSDDFNRFIKNSSPSDLIDDFFKYKEQQFAHSLRSLHSLLSINPDLEHILSVNASQFKKQVELVSRFSY